MQGASLPEPAENLLIVSRKLNDLYSRKQPQTTVRGKQVITVLEQRIIGDLLLIMADIACKQGHFVFDKRRDGKRRFAGQDVLQPHKLKEVCRELALRVVSGAIAVGKMYSVFCVPFLPLLKHVHDVAAVLMQSQQQPPKGPHAAQQKVAQLFEEFAVEVRQRC